MVIIEGKLVSDEILERKFICNLNACKGACCWKGDYGAPLEEAELQTLEAIYEDIKPFISPRGQKAIEEKGKYQFYTTDDVNEWGTTLLEDEACVYMTLKDGVAQCGIEAAYNAGVTDFKKPISCHLYPIRISTNKETGFEALNYDEWDICQAACTLGEKEQMPVYQFLKEAIHRKYGADFYNQLEGVVAFLKEGEKE